MRAFIGVALLMIAAIGCSGPADGCRSAADCSGGASCVPPGSPPGCGIPCMAERTCASSADCAAGDVCIEYISACCSALEPSTQCAAPCTDTACAEGDRCDAATGLCIALSCDAGFECEPFTRCEVGAAGADGHGCVRNACAGDGDCSGGACVFGLCYESAGECMGPFP